MATKIVNTTQKVDNVKYSLNYEHIFGKHKLNIGNTHSDDQMSINEMELISETYRINSSVAGHETGIRITHIPTNIVVSCGKHRSLYKNKKTAMCDLKWKIKQHKEK